MEIHYTSFRIFLFFFYFILFVIPVLSTVELSNHDLHRRLSNVSDYEALRGFMSEVATYNPSQSLSTLWKSNVSFCEWTGIICSRRRHRVVSINVSSMALEGTISPLIANLSFLRILDLSNNSFSGHIPYQLGRLFRLKMLLLSLNQLQGCIPPTLHGCRSLTNFSMSHNHLSGNIPSQLCILPHLQYINLGYNILTGIIPACLGNISSLEEIRLANNSLHGPVPWKLGLLSILSVISMGDNRLTGQIPAELCSKNTRLTVLSLYLNKLSGTIPPSLCNCTKLQRIYFWGNQLTGHIPPSLSNCTKFQVINFEGNHLTGHIPPSLSNCTKLQIIDIGGNQLSGVVPMELGRLTDLTDLYLDDNQLISGIATNLPIITALTNCSNLETIYLSSNRFTGHLPFSIGHLSTKVEVLDLGSNELVGEIPQQTGNLTNLTYLNLDSNFFTGAIPSSLEMLQMLERLYLGSNNLKGNIPTKIGNLHNLGLLHLERNNLSGRIPDSIANLQQLRYLNLAHNQLSGHIPGKLGKCVNLLLLDLSYNIFSGRIPPQVAGLSNLAFYLNLSNNVLHGPLPSELSKMTMVQAMDISTNQLSGYIPSVLGSCEELEYLNLSCNALDGPIPDSLGYLRSLQDMDLSFNRLSGGIPLSLESLKMLHHLNLSFNKLSGEVTKGGICKKFGATAFMGNLGLCGLWVSQSPFSATKHRSGFHMQRVIMLVVAIIATIVSCLFVQFLWRRSGKRHIIGMVVPSLKVWHQRISYAELMTATKEFSDDNLLGTGSFGKVYKAVLNNGTVVAIKLLNLETEGAHKSFDRECKVLGRIRHRNLIKIITSYSDPQLKALIFPLMPNGSLEKWLYPDGEEKCCLTLIQRLNIAIDIAQGIAYLHHHCFVQVIHCDMKPSNVLLGEDMTAYVIDFGIATICYADYEDSTFTSTHALKGTPGYIPPEYGLGAHITTKGDVYSYGIVILEMLTRKKPTHDMFVEGINLQNWVHNGFPNQVEKVVDKTLLKTIGMSTEKYKDHLDCLSQLISVGLICTRESPKERPTMMDIIGILQSIRKTLLGATGIQKFPLLTNLLENTSIAHNNIDTGQSSSTF